MKRKTFLVRWPEALVREIDAHAKAAGMSRNAWLQELIEKGFGWT